MRQIYSPVNAEIFMKISLLIVTNVNLAVPCDEILDGVICFICFKVNVLTFVQVQYWNQVLLHREEKKLFGKFHTEKGLYFHFVLLVLIP